MGAWEGKGWTNDQNASGMSSYVWSRFPTILKLLTERRTLVRHALFGLLLAGSVKKENYNVGGCLQDTGRKDYGDAELSLERHLQG